MITYYSSLSCSPSPGRPDADERILTKGVGFGHTKDIPPSLPLLPLSPFENYFIPEVGACMV
jgi:hypothetical protein